MGYAQSGRSFPIFNPATEKCWPWLQRLMRVMFTLQWLLLAGHSRRLVVGYDTGCAHPRAAQNR
jgi:hypothetical protein